MPRLIRSVVCASRLPRSQKKLQDAQRGLLVLVPFHQATPSFQICCSPLETAASETISGQERASIGQELAQLRLTILGNVNARDGNGQPLFAGEAAHSVAFRRMSSRRAFRNAVSDILYFSWLVNFGFGTRTATARYRSTSGRAASRPCSRRSRR